MYLKSFSHEYYRAFDLWGVWTFLRKLAEMALAVISNAVEQAIRLSRRRLKTAQDIHWGRAGTAETS
jgi:hypothetical protein